MGLDLNLTLIEAIQGKNPCFANDRRITGIVAPLAHDVGCHATHAGRFVECPNYLEADSAGLPTWTKTLVVNNGDRVLSGGNVYRWTLETPGTGVKVTANGWVKEYRNLSKNWWNKITVRKMVHGFAGLDANEKWVVAITLPFDTACWGCAGGSKGSYNYPATKASPKQFAHIQIECCQDDKKSREFYEAAMDTQAKFYAWTIQQGICSDDLSLITCHREAHQLGFAGNHSDLWDWAAKFGETQKTYMPSYRERVKKFLDAGPIQVTWHFDSHMNTCKQSTRYSPTARYLQTCLNRLGYPCETDGLLWNETLAQLKAFQRDWYLTDSGICDQLTWITLMDALNGKKPVPPPPVQHYIGTVSANNYISLWKNTGKTSRVCKVPSGANVEVTSDCIKGTLAPAKYGIYNGYVDTQYLVNRVNI